MSLIKSIHSFSTATYKDFWFVVAAAIAEIDCNKEGHLVETNSPNRRFSKLVSSP